MFSFSCKTCFTAVLMGFSLVAQDAKPDNPIGIQDNSFLVEEAYNQEDGVVQHISGFTRYRQTQDWMYTFTQEWPVGGLKHQFSYTLPWQRIQAAPDGKRGAGDIALNYRYQLLGDGNASVAISPRFSLLLPTGRAEQGRGAGAVGYQFNLPISVVLGSRAVTHFNFGATYTPNAKNALGDEAHLTAYTFGQSFIWLVQPTFNLMLEIAYTSGESVRGPSLKDPSNNFYVSPGIRWAYNFPSGLQIVPGIAFPIGTGPSKRERAVFFYLSFEHPFRKTAK
jgi:hypothetical protein